MYNVRPVIVPFRHSRYRAGQTELRPLLAAHRHNYDNWHIGTHDVYGASTKQQLSKPGVYIAVKKGEEGSSPRSLSLLTTLMVVWKLPSGVSVYVLGWERFFNKENFVVDRL